MSGNTWILEHMRLHYDFLCLIFTRDKQPMHNSSVNSYIYAEKTHNTNISTSWVSSSFTTASASSALTGSFSEGFNLTSGGTVAVALVGGTAVGTGLASLCSAGRTDGLEGLCPPSRTDGLEGLCSDSMTDGLVGLVPAPC